MCAYQLAVLAIFGVPAGLPGRLRHAALAGGIFKFKGVGVISAPAAWRLAGQILRNLKFSRGGGVITGGGGYFYLEGWDYYRNGIPSLECHW